MRILNGDKVKVISGSFKGTVGDVIKVNPKEIWQILGSLLWLKAKTKI